MSYIYGTHVILTETFVIVTTFNHIRHIFAPKVNPMSNEATIPTTKYKEQRPLA